MKVKVIGGGLAGVEACYQLLKRGFDVELYEMRPKKMTPAHKTEGLAELVCSNSLKSMENSTASGLLKDEMSLISSIILNNAYKAKVPSGSALSVDRDKFSKCIENELKVFKNLTIINEEVTLIDWNIPTVIATGPLTSEGMFEALKAYTGSENLYFYDAVSPIVANESIDFSKAFYASRYNKGDSDDYLNCPMNKEEYDIFYNELVNAEGVILKGFEKNIFESCMPIEVIAKRGYDTMRFGPLKPVGLYDENDKKHYAVLQLRKENKNGSMFNLVGFQTNVTFKEQKRIFSLIPALKNAEFLRYGVMHRNTYINSPLILNKFFQHKNFPNLFFAGQITGVEGYMESAASGMLAGINLARYLLNKEMIIPPEECILGSLSEYVASGNGVSFQPMNSNFGILPPLEGKFKDKNTRKLEYYNRSIAKIKEFIEKNSYSF